MIESTSRIKSLFQKIICIRFGIEIYYLIVLKLRFRIMRIHFFVIKVEMKISHKINLCAQKKEKMTITVIQSIRY